MNTPNHQRKLNLFFPKSPEEPVAKLETFEPTTVEQQQAHDQQLLRHILSPKS